MKNQPKFKFDSVKFVDIDIRHITATDRKLMRAPSTPVRYIDVAPSHEPGQHAIFSTPINETEMEDLRVFGFSDAYRELMRQLQEQGITLACFMETGDVVENAPVFPL